MAQVEEEKHGDGRGCEAAHFGRLASASLVQAGSDEIDGEEAKSSTDQALPPTESVNDLSADDGTDDPDCVQTTGQSILLKRSVASRLEKHRRIGSHGRDTSPRYHGLQPNAEPSSPSEMRLDVCGTTKQDSGELDGRARLGVPGQGAYFEGFLLHRGRTPSSNMFQHIFCFSSTSDSGEIMRRVGQ